MSKANCMLDCWDGTQLMQGPKLYKQTQYSFGMCYIKLVSLNLGPTFILYHPSIVRFCIVCKVSQIIAYKCPFSFFSTKTVGVMCLCVLA